MPTKLKTPIVITIDYAENAVDWMLELETRNWPTNSRRLDILNRAKENHIWDQLEKGASLNGIDYRTWQPPTPLRAGSYDVEILADGSIKVGCQNVTNDQFEAIVKARGEVVKGKEEWPKWFKRTGGDGMHAGLAKATSSTDRITWFSTSSTNSWQGGTAEEGWKIINRDYTPITRAEFSKILGREV